MSKLIKICGKRSAFLTLLSIISALLVGYGVFSSKIYISIFAMAFFVLLIFYACINKEKSLLILLTIVFFGFSIYGICIFNHINSIDISPNTIYKVVGKVPTDYSSSNGNHTFILENCEIYENDYLIYDNQNIKVVSKTSVYSVNPGDIVLFESNLSREELFEFDRFNNSAIPKGVYFFAYLKNEPTILDSNQLNIKDKIHLKVKDSFSTCMDSDSASLAYAVTFGDKYYIQTDVMTSFRYSGMAHILAVSGLHTSIIFTILAFLLSKLKLRNKKINTIIILILLAIYCYLCSFSPSIMRASIMCLVAYFSFTGFLRSDTLNNLGIAGIIILTINPLDLFNIGFLLSFACIFGIALFAKPILKLLKTKNIITSTIALTVATQLTLLPLLAYFFGYFTLLSFVSNLFLLPIFVFLFNFIIIGAFISLIFTPTLLFQILSKILEIFIDFNVYLSNFDIAIIPLFKIGIIGIICYLVLSFVLANRAFIRRQAKAVLVAILIVAITFSCVYSTIPKTEINTSFSVKDCPTTHYFKLDNNDFCLINPFTTPTTLYNTKNTLYMINQTEITHLFITDTAMISIGDLNAFLTDYKVVNVYIAPYLYDEYNASIDILSKNTNLTILEPDQTYNVGTYLKFVGISTTDGYIKYYLNDKQYIVYQPK